MSDIRWNNGRRGWETSEQLEYVPSQLKVLVHKRAVYACPEKHDEATLITAPKPAQPIAKGLAGPGLLAAMVVGKFGDHLPGYRLEDILLRQGADIHRSTIYDWMSSVADLLKPLYNQHSRDPHGSLLGRHSAVCWSDCSVAIFERKLVTTGSAGWAYLGDKVNP